jgi:hypothetical protein
VHETDKPEARNLRLLSDVSWKDVKTTVPMASKVRIMIVIFHQEEGTSLRERLVLHRLWENKGTSPFPPLPFSHARLV